MPFAYRRRRQTAAKRVSAQETLARKKLTMLRRKKANPVTNASKITNLTKQVKSLKVAEYGQKQMMRQILNATNGLPDSQSCRVSAKLPVGFCHQAIDVNNSLYQPNFDPITGNYVVSPTATWVTQPFPLASIDANSTRYDQLKYLQANSIGVQPGYLHHSTSYNLKFNAVNWRGWCDVLVVTTRRQFTRQRAPDNDSFQMPGALIGFANTCGGTPNQYSWNPLYYGVKRIRRMYFNTAESDPGIVQEKAIYTNPDKFTSMVVRNSKSRSHIRAQHQAEYNIPPATPTSQISHLDIALNQQDWIIITTSNPDDPTGESYLAVSLTRCAVFRDPVGSS